ncbi:MAG: aminotransferase class IV [Planctomycetaceae bacterium]
MSEPIAILNGRVLPVSRAALSLFDTGFVHGAAVGDVVRTFGHNPFRLDEHLARLRCGIEALGIPTAPDEREFREAVFEVVRHNAGRIAADRDLGVVVFVTAGMNATYLGTADRATASRCTWGVHTFPLPFEFWAAKMQHGQRLVIPETRQIPADCLNGQIKWRNRAHWILADRLARRTDPEASALLLDFDGHVTETSTANFFAVTDGRLRTPKPENTLDGVSRRVVFELADRLGIPCEFSDLTRDDALAADESFTSSTTCCLMPVTAIDGRRIGDEVPGPVYRRLMDAWNQLAGMNIIEQIVTGAEDRNREVVS